MNRTDSIYQQVERYLSILTQEIERIWSAEELAYYKLTPEKLRQISEGLIDVDHGIDGRSLRLISAKEKFVFYLLLLISEELVDTSRLRIFPLWRETWILRLQKELSGNEIISVISKLNSIYFRLWTLDYFHIEKNRRLFFSVLLGKSKKDKNSKNLLEKLSSRSFGYLLFYRTRPTPVKTVFRKGYRDHGSLGSDYSKILKEERDDIFLRLAEEMKQKREQDTIAFLKGFLE